MNNLSTKILKTIPILVALGCLFLAIFPPISDEKREKFQQSTVPASLLEFGETGKILKQIEAVYPIENKKSGIKEHQNVREVIERADEDRKKWLTMGPHQGYRDSGIFCYFEMSSEEERIPLIISKSDQGTWKKIKSLPIRSGRDIHAFFLDLNQENITLDFFFRNTKKEIKIRTIVLHQPKYHPLVYYDPISYMKFLRKAEKSKYKVGSDSVVILPSDRGTHLKVDLSFKNKGVEGISKYQKKQGKSRIEITTREYHPLLDSLSLGDQELQRKSIAGLPTLAIDISEQDLFSNEYGILKNYAGHGRDWERLSYVRYFRDGEQILNTFTGLRLHGGDPGRELGLVNFRIYFRDEYGDSSVRQELIFKEKQGLIKRLSVKQSQWEKWPLNSPIAYEIGDHLGALTPTTELVQLYLNGEDKGLYYLVPHLGENQIGLMFPELDLKYFRYRGRQHDADHYFVQADFWYRLSKAETIDKNFADQFFDLENLIAQIITIVFSGTGDFCQGVILKDDIPSGKLFWYMWDMDHSFLDIRVDIDGQSKLHERWEKSPSIDTFFKLQERVGEDCPRSYLFKSLVNFDPSFRYEAISRLISAINHQLTDSYLNELLWRYWNKLDSVAYPHRQEYIGNLSEYFQQRKSFLFKEIETSFPSLTLKECEVISPIPFTVDGYLKQGGYTGYHLAGQVLNIDIQRGGQDTGIYVNDKLLQGQQISHLISEEEDCKLHIQER